MLAPACLVLSLAHAQAITPQVRQHFIAAEQDQQRGQLDAAISEYRAVLHLQHDIPEAYLNLGLIYFAQANFPESAKELTQAKKLRPHMRGVSLWLGIDYVKLNQPACAVPLLYQATLIDPEDKQAQGWLGIALWDSGSTAAAISQLAKANRLFPDDLNISYDLGEAYRKTSNQEVESIITASAGEPLQNQIYGDIYRQRKMWLKAMAHYELAIKRDPQWHGAHLGIGRIYLAEHELARAQSEFKSELTVNPSSAAAYALLGESLILQGHIPQALKMLHVAVGNSPEAASAALGIPPQPLETIDPLSQTERKALGSAEAIVEQSPSSPAGSLALAFIKLQLHKSNFDGAWIHFRDSVKRHPVPASIKERGVLAFDRGQYDSAKISLQKWLWLHPDDLKARYLLARTYRQLSLQILGELMRRYPDSYRSHELLAETYENRGDDEEALREYRIVEELAPDLPFIHLEIGQILWKDTHPNEALEELHKELQLDPENPEAVGEIGTILVEQHEPLKAIPYLQKALRLEPDLWLIHKQLGTAYMIEKNYPMAQSQFLKALNHDPDGAVHYQLALVYRAEGRRNDAAKEFEAARMIKEKHPDQIYDTPQKSGAL